jgi:hypothetical protein
MRGRVNGVSAREQHAAPRSLVEGASRVPFWAVSLRLLPVARAERSIPVRNQSTLDDLRSPLAKSMGDLLAREGRPLTLDTATRLSA